MLGKALIHDVPEEYAIHKEKGSPSTKFVSLTVIVCCGAAIEC